MKNLKTFGQLNEADTPSVPGFELDGEHSPKYDNLIGRIYLVVDNFKEPPTVMNDSHFVITAVSEDGKIESNYVSGPDKDQPYPSKTIFAQDEYFDQFAQGQAAWIHPGEVYAVLKPVEVN